MPQRHSATKTQCHKDTMPQRHSATKTQCHKDTVPQRHSATKTQCHKDTMPQRHSATKTQCHKSTFAFSCTQAHSHAPTHTHTHTQMHAPSWEYVAKPHTPAPNLQQPVPLKHHMEAIGVQGWRVADPAQRTESACSQSVHLCTYASMYLAVLCQMGRAREAQDMSSSPANANDFALSFGGHSMGGMVQKCCEQRRGTFGPVKSSLLIYPAAQAVQHHDCGG